MPCSHSKYDFMESEDESYRQNRNGRTRFNMTREEINLTLEQRRRIHLMENATDEPPRFPTQQASRPVRSLRLNFQLQENSVEGAVASTSTSANPSACSSSSSSQVAPVSIRVLQDTEEPSNVHRASEDGAVASTSTSADPIASGSSLSQHAPVIIRVPQEPSNAHRGSEDSGYATCRNSREAGGESSRNGHRVEVDEGDSGDSDVIVVGPPIPPPRTSSSNTRNGSTNRNTRVGNGDMRRNGSATHYYRDLGYTPRSPPPPYRETPSPPRPIIIPHHPVGMRQPRRRPLPPYSITAPYMDDWENTTSSASTSTQSESRGYYYSSPPPINYSSNPINYSATPNNYSATPNNYSATPINYSATPINYSATPINYSATPMNESFTNVPTFNRENAVNPSPDREFIPWFAATTMQLVMDRLMNTTVSLPVPRAGDPQPVPMPCITIYPCFLAGISIPNPTNQGSAPERAASTNPTGAVYEQPLFARNGGGTGTRGGIPNGMGTVSDVQTNHRQPTRRVPRASATVTSESAEPSFDRSISPLNFRMYRITGERRYDGASFQNGRPSVGQHMNNNAPSSSFLQDHDESRFERRIENTNYRPQEHGPRRRNSALAPPPPPPLSPILDLTTSSSNTDRRYERSPEESLLNSNRYSSAMDAARRSAEIGSEAAQREIDAFSARIATRREDQPQASSSRRPKRNAGESSSRNRNDHKRRRSSHYNSTASGSGRGREREREERTSNNNGQRQRDAEYRNNQRDRDHHHDHRRRHSSTRRDADNYSRSSTSSRSRHSRRNYR